MPRVIERTIYKFDELSERAKEAARQHVRENNPNQSHDWWDCIYDQAAEVGALMGITIDTKTVKLHGGGTREDPCIHFSGFWSQGDGASFKGRYGFMPDAINAVENWAAQDSDLHAIVKELTLLQVTARLQTGGQLEAVITLSGNYSHSGAMDVEVNYVDVPDEAPSPTTEVEKELTDLLRRFADWIYEQLKQEDEYLNSDKCVDEQLADDEFDEDGSIV